MWEKDPRCINCSVVTVLPKDLVQTDSYGMMLPGVTIPSNMATIGHRYCRLDNRRRTATPTEKRYRLLCHKCNNEENRIEQKIFIEEQRIKSGGPPDRDRSIKELTRKMVFLFLDSSEKPLSNIFRSIGIRSHRKKAKKVIATIKRVMVRILGRQGKHEFKNVSSSFQPKPS